MNKTKLMTIAVGFGVTGVAIPTSAYLNNLSLDDISLNKKLDIDFDNNQPLNKVDNKLYNISNNNAKYVSSLKGNALEANNSKIVVPFSDLDLSDKDKVITVSFLMKWEGNDTSFFPVSIHGGTGNGSNNIWVRQGYIGFNTGNGDVYGKSTKIEKNKYYSIVAEFNYGDISKNKLYIDGIKQDLSYVHGSGSLPNIWQSDANFSIAGYALNDNYNMKDKSIVDEVKLYTKSLSQTEVNEVTNAHKIPELQGEIVKNSYPKLDWATEMLPENVFWQVGYESNEQENIGLVYNVNNNMGDGGQYFGSKNVYSGNYSVYTPITRPDKGNWVLSPYTVPSVSNHIFYNGNSITFNNDDRISISYRIKTNQKASVRILADWKYEKKFKSYGVTTTKDIKKGAKEIPVTDASKFKYDGRITFEDNENVINESLIKRVLSADTTTNIVTLTSGVPFDIPAGTELIYRNSLWAFEDSTKNINPSNEWQLINFNTGLSKSDYLDWSEYALNLRQGWATYGDAYLDDLKIGYATKVRLYRNGSKVYEGYNATFNDTTATDKTIPDKINTALINSTMEMLNTSTSQRKLKLKFEPVEDNGTTYNYQVSSIDKNGKESPKSETVSQTVKSGLKGYSYVIDKSPSTTPNNTVNTTGTNIEHNITDSGTYYLHIKAIDNAGNSSDVVHYKIDVPILTAQAKPVEDLIRLDWNMSDTNNKTFKVYQKKPGSTEFQTVSSTNFDTTKEVKVLNVYPVRTSTGVLLPIETFTNWKGETHTLPQSARLKRWMEEPNSEDSKGYGQGIIDVTPVSIDDFNSNFNSIMKNSDGTWKYDVIMLGSWDGGANTAPVLDTNAVALIGEYISSGRGFLAGHDTIGHVQGSQQGLGRIRNLFNIKVGSWDWGNPVPDEGHGYFGGYMSNKTILQRKGLLTNYPWKLGDVGTQFDIPITHSTSNFAYGDIWMTFPEGEFYNGTNIPSSLYPYANYYLTTWNNTAMIQTGHSNGSAKEDEQKILANTLFYLNQLSTDNYLDDNSGQDVNSPNIPHIYEHNFIRVGEVEFKFNPVVDNGSMYEYYVESQTKDNNNLTLSNVVSETITSGLKGYSYVVDHNEDTIPDDTVDVTTAGSLKVNLDNSSKYIHIKAIDKAGSVSDTFHYKIDDNNAPNLDIYLENEEITNNEVKIMVNAWDNDFESGIQKVKLPNGNFITASEGMNSIQTAYKVSSNGTYEFIAYDNAGNTKTKSINVTNIDNDAPTMIITGNPTSWVAGKATLEISIEDSFSGADSITLPNGNVVKGSNATFVVSSNGEYTFVGRDVLGNEVSQTVIVQFIDNNSPQISYRKELNSDKTLMKIPISGYDSQSGIDYFVTPEGDKRYSNFIYEVTENGIYPFEVYDKVGKSTKIAISVFELNANIVPSEIDKIEYKLSGATTKDWTEYREAFCVTNEGITNITARSYDKAGNLSDETTSIVRIDKTKPNSNSIKIELK